VELQEKTIQVNGLPVHYWEAGEENGRPLLLLHGGIGDAELHWKAVMPSLAESFYRVIAPDLPGYGGTAALPDMSLQGLVDWLRSFLQALQLEQAVVVGNSISALPVRLFAAAHPTYTPAIILVNGGALPNTPPLLATLARIPVINQLLFSMLGRSAASRQSLEQMIFVKEVLTAAFINQAEASAPRFARLMRGILSYPIPEKHNPPVPILLLWGADDKTAPVEDAEALKKDMPGAKLSTVAECGQMPHLETPDVFVYQVNYFLGRISRPPGSELPGVGMLKPKSS
jgi:pimeloyl-ACP methyl ester carboxylesterase